MPQGLFDALSGAATGHAMNRQGLEAAVANSQTINGLRSAQTENALLNAQKAREEQDANSRLETNLGGLFSGDPQRESKARAAADVVKGGGTAVQALEMLDKVQQNQFHQTMGDPNQLNQASQTAAAQGISGKLVEPVAAPANMVVPAGVTPNIQQTPEGIAQTANTNAQAKLHNAQADAGGFNPHTGPMGSLAPDHVAALQQAIQDGRLDPSRLNSRTAPIYAEIELRNPGGVNFNRLTADAALQRNPAFQQKAMGFEALPTVMQHMTTLGKKIGYSDWRTVGKMQQFMNGEMNDPDYTEYMSVRNDALMNIASIMRGVGMSDQAHKAEMEAAAPTLSPLALDGWYKGQMATLKPRLDQIQRVEHLGDRKNTPVGAPQPGAGGDVPAGLTVLN